MIEREKNADGWRVVAAAGLLLLAAGPVLGAGPVYWDYPERQSFRDLELEGAGLDANGLVVPGLTATPVFEQPPEVVWCAEPSGEGEIYLGSGHDGRIWRLRGGGRAELFVELDCTEVFCLLRRGATLFAGCGPEGRLYAIAADGTVELWGTVEEEYVWDLVATEDGELYAAAGSPAAIYRVRGPQQLERIAELPAANALDLAVDGREPLLVATQGPGRIYRLARDGAAAVVYEADQDEIRQLLRGPDAAWYALALAGEAVAEGAGQNANGADDGGSSSSIRSRTKAAEPSRAALLRLGDDGMVTPFWSGSDELMIAAYSRSYGWLAAGAPDAESGRARLLSLFPPAGAQPLATWTGGDALALLVVPGDGDPDVVIACLAQPGQAVRLEPERGARCRAISQPLDAGRRVRWGRLTWEGSGRLEWSVRGGNSSVPDASWTDWSDSWRDGDRSLELPALRFLQWRVEFVEAAADDRLASVTVSGYESNLPPQILRFDMVPPGEVQLGGLMPRGDNLTETLRNGLRIEYSVGSKSETQPEPARVAPVRAVHTFTWQAADPNGDRLTYQLEYRPAAGGAWRPVAEETGEELGSWNTASVPDGSYEVRLRASDRPDNPAAEAATAIRELPPFLVDHTAPEISDFELVATATGFGVRFRAEDALSTLAGAIIELPDGARERLDPTDAICDSRRERFDAELAFPRPESGAAPRPWHVRVEVYDRPGNVAAIEGDVR
jgi:hypothetical protein